MMGSFRRPRPRFMSSPVLSDLARFHASAPCLQLSNASVWNSVQSAVIKVFEGGALQTNELYTLNESIRWLLKTELGSFITEYFQKQLLTRALSDVLDQILHSAEDRLLVLSDTWDKFFTETLPTLQAIFYPVQGQELTVRQMSLLAFRDLVLLKLHLQETLGSAACIPAPVTHMLLVLQGVHEGGGVSVEYAQLERLVEAVVRPYVCNVNNNNNNKQLRSEAPPPRSSGWLLGPEIMVTHHSSSDSASLAPLVEQEGEAYLERTGGLRRHTVANAPSDARLLAEARGRGEGGGGGTFLLGAEPLSPGLFSSQTDTVQGDRVS